MVTPEQGSMQLTGLKTGRPYGYSLYSSDVVGNTPVTFALTGIAGTGSTNFIIVPEDCVVTDLAIHTGQTVSSSWTFWANDAPVPASVVTYVQILDSLTARSFPALKIAKGTKLQLMQN